MEFRTLASSSAGNAALVCHENTHILIDAGISCRRIAQSLVALGTELLLLLLEANHDVEMLRSGPYPCYLKQRILSDRGHLSNGAAAEFALECAERGTEDILLAHLSAENNTPQLAEYTVGRALQAGGLSVRLAAPRDTISEVHLCRRSPSFASAN